MQRLQCLHSEPSLDLGNKLMQVIHTKNITSIPFLLTASRSALVSSFNFFSLAALFLASLSTCFALAAKSALISLSCSVFSTSNPLPRLSRKVKTSYEATCRTREQPQRTCWAWLHTELLLWLLSSGLESEPMPPLAFGLSVVLNYIITYWLW